MNKNLLKIILGIIAVVIILCYIFPFYFFSNQKQVRDFIQRYGIYGPLILIGLQVLQILITPMSASAIGVAGGYLFGFWPGFFYNWIGRIIGCTIAFFIGKKIGRIFIDKLVKKETSKKYDKLIEKNSWILMLMYFFPFFPDDEITYLVGASSMKYKKYAPVMIIGHIGGSFMFSYIGNGTSISDPLLWLFMSIALIGGLLTIKYLSKIKKEK